VKYWVYKESRILGPFDKEAVSGLPGLDAGTLVCAGDPAGGSWTPAGELSDLAGVPAGLAGVVDDFPSSAALLDQLQIDSAGLIGDDEFTASFAEELFQDASFKKDFKDILTSRIMPDESEARRARDKISELTAQLEAMYLHVTKLETGQADLNRRLALKDLELRARGGAEALLPTSMEPPAELEQAPAKTFLSPLPPPIPGGPPPVAAVSDAAPPLVEWPQAPTGSAVFPTFGAGAPPPAEIQTPEPAAAPPPALPDIPSFAASREEPAPPPPEAPPAPARLSFGKPKSFKTAPTKKSFKVLGVDEASPGVAANPVPEFKVEPISETPFPQPVAAPTVPAPAAEAPPPPPPAPIALEPVMPPAILPADVPPPPVPVSIFPTAESAPVPNPFTLPPRPEPAAFAPPAPTPVAPPPNTLNRSQPVPDFNSAFSGAASDEQPPATMARSGGAGDGSAAAEGVAARFAKPEPAPATGEIKKPARNNKPFLIGGGVLVVLLIVLGVIFMRQPKDDLKQMTTLDDGKAPIGLTADDGAAAPPPITKPRIAEPPPAPPGPSAEHLAAIEVVKDFPLDGGRGTVGRWLQYSYTASPDAGTEEWNASTTGENTVLVEYRLIPSPAGGKGALYLFEVDANGLVMGKNIEARQMLAGAPPPDAPKAKKKPAKKPSAKRRPIVEEQREVPLLPLPDSGELRPPAEDDGSFGSDTINSGI